jgi:phage-related protein
MGSNITFGGTSLSPLGFSVLALDRSVPGVDVFQMDVPGREYVDTWAARPTETDLSIGGMVTDPSNPYTPTRANLLSAVAAVVNACAPSRGWQNLSVTDVDDKHLVCMGNGIEIAEEYPMFVKPYLPVLLHFRRRPYWYADTPTTGTLVGSLTNAGSVTAYPIWTFTIGTGGEPFGVTVTVGTQVFQYLAALSHNDSLVVNTDPAVLSVRRNGRDVSPGTVYSYSDFPSLVPGMNVTSITGNAVVTYSFYARHLFGG